VQAQPSQHGGEQGGERFVFVFCCHIDHIKEKTGTRATRPTLAWVRHGYSEFRGGAGGSVHECCRGSNGGEAKPTAGGSCCPAKADKL
jgi:hypothetical protein